MPKLTTNRAIALQGRKGYSKNSKTHRLPTHKKSKQYYRELALRRYRNVQGGENNENEQITASAKPAEPKASPNKRRLCQEPLEDVTDHPGDTFISSESNNASNSNVPRLVLHCQRPSGSKQAVLVPIPSQVIQDECDSDVSGKVPSFRNIVVTASDSSRESRSKTKQNKSTSKPKATKQISLIKWPSLTWWREGELIPPEVVLGVDLGTFQ